MISDPKPGDVVRYHPILGRPSFRRITVLTEPYALGDGHRILKGRDLRDSKMVYPRLEALTEDRDDAPMPTTFRVGDRVIARNDAHGTVERVRMEADVERVFVRWDEGGSLEAPADAFRPGFRREYPATFVGEPAPNGPADLGWNEQSTTRGPRPTRRAVTFPIPPSSPLQDCRSCRAPIHWIVTAAGKRMPVNPDGTSHFADCPNAATHRRAR